MDSINITRALAIGLTLVSLCACSTLKLKSTPKQSLSPTVAEDGSIIQAIPNPYLSQQVKIPDGAQTQFNQALESMKSKHWDKAETQLTALTTAYPTLSGPYVNLGIVYWQKDALERASEAFNKAIELNSLNSDAYLEFALMLREQGQFKDAETLYLQALEVWPHNIQAHLHLGILYDMYMGKFESAVKHYEMAQKLQSEPDKQLAGWILDTQRRIPAAQSAPASTEKHAEAQ